MSGKPWFRMYAEFLTDPKVQKLSEADQRRFIMLLCMRCGSGDVTLQDDDIAFQLRITDAEWAATKAVLMGRGLISEDNKPTNWDKRQFVSDSSNERVSRHREKLKQQRNDDVTLQKRPQTQNPDTDTDLPPQPPAAIGRQEVRNLIGGVGLGIEARAGISPETKRQVCQCLNIEDAAPLVRVFDEWTAGRPAKTNRNRWFLKSAPTLWRNADATVRDACQPIVKPPDEPMKAVRPSSSLAASRLVSGVLRQ